MKDYAAQTRTPCLHAGLASDYAEIIWNDVYQVPSDINDDVCDYPLARNLVMLTVAVACEAIASFIAAREQRNFTITLKDLTSIAAQTWELAKLPLASAANSPN